MADDDGGSRRPLFFVLGAWLGSSADAHRWIPPAAALAGSVVAAVLFANPSFVTIAIGVFALVLGGLPEIAAAWWRTEEEKANEGTGTQYRLAMKDALGPIAELIRELLSSPVEHREGLIRQIAQQSVGAVVMQFDKDKRVRSVVYAVSDDGERMTSMAHTGRDQQPQSFERGTHRGNLAFKTLVSGEPLFVPDLADVKEENPKKWSGSGEGYATFITVPIGDADGGYGLLTVDAPVAGTFDETDAYFVQVLAKMMGLAYAARDSEPPSSDVGGTVSDEGEV